MCLATSVVNHTFPLHLSVHEPKYMYDIQSKNTYDLQSTRFTVILCFVFSLCLCNCNPLRVKESFGRYVRVNMDLVMGKNYYCEYIIHVHKI